MSSPVSFKSIKDKLKHTSLGETVTGKINSIINHDTSAHGSSASFGTSPSASPTHRHTRSPSTDSVQSDKGKEPLSSKTSVSSDARRHSFEMVDGNEQVKEAQTAGMYEQQLMQLQEQLVTSMIDNQNMASELKKIKEDKQVQALEKQLEYEKKKNNELLVKITKMAQQTTARPPPAQVNNDADDVTTLPVPGEQTVEPEAAPAPNGLVDRVFYFILQRFYQVMEDFSVTSDDVEVQEEVDALAVKTLKDNVKRFGNGVSPLLDTMASFKLLFHWHSPLLTGSIFIVYMYASWTGFLIPALLFLLALRLFLNLMEEWKIMPAIRLLPYIAKPTQEKEKESSVSDKFNVVLDVATKVQNKFGVLADGMEKLKNLLTWKRPEDTKQIFIPLCVMFSVSMFISIDTLVFMMGSFLGIKLFIIDPVYHRFPRVKDKYDGTHKLWGRLLTDVELEKQNLRKANNQMVLPKNQLSGSTRSLNADSRQSSTLSLTHADVMTAEDKEFCERFHLPDDEKPLSTSPFKDGRHCIHMDKDSALKVTTAYHNHAKLYLTPSFLCYEMVRQDEKRVIPLANITRIEKKKPISFLPGNGSALEVAEQGFEKPHIFGGLLHRDDCYNALMDIGKHNSLQYYRPPSELKTQLRLSDLADVDSDISTPSGPLPQVVDNFSM